MRVDACVLCTMNTVICLYILFEIFRIRVSWFCKTQCSRPCWWDTARQKWPLLLLLLLFIMFLFYFLKSPFLSLSLLPASASVPRKASSRWRQSVDCGACGWEHGHFTPLRRTQWRWLCEDRCHKKKFSGINNWALLTNELDITVLADCS